MKQSKSGQFLRQENTKDRSPCGRIFPIGLLRWALTAMLIGAGATESASMLDGAVYIGSDAAFAKYPWLNLIDAHKL